MACDVMHRNKRFMIGKCDRLCGHDADMERADETRTERVGNRVDLIHCTARSCQRFRYDRRNVLNVNAACDFRHNSAVQRMRIDLAAYDIRKNLIAVAHNGTCGFIAA